MIPAAGDFHGYSINESFLAAAFTCFKKLTFTITESDVDVTIEFDNVTLIV